MNKVNAMSAFLALAGAAAVASAGAADVYVSEIYAGLTGGDGTADWFEVTYQGAGTFDTASLFFEDDSEDPENAGSMSSFILNTGESAVFVIGADASDLAEFTSIWGSIANLGAANGGGNLGQGGDGVFLYDGNSAGANLIASQTFDDNHNTTLATWEFDAFGAAQYSVDGVNGAYTSASFFNEDLGLPNDTASLIGSPGAIPAPGVLAILGLGGIAAGFRRRA